jgi:hypothetical protein
MDKILYLIGAGAAMAEMEHQGIESRLRMEDIDEAVYQMSKLEGGKYAQLHDDFALPVGIDIEVMISLLEGCTSSESTTFSEVCDELKKFFRIYLITQIMGKQLQPKISSSLLHIHREYGPQMGRSGEELVGILTINYDSLLEEAFVTVHGAINYGYPFESAIYKSDNQVPKLLKLHGSFNWKIHGSNTLTKNLLKISKEFEREDYDDDYSGWIPPSVYKRPGGVIESIWDDAVGLLTECNTLRVIGSSLRDQDSALLSLIFTSRLKNRSTTGKGFNIELIVPDIDAAGTDENPIAIMQRIRYLGGMVNFSQLDVYPQDFTTTGNVYKEWLQMKITEIERNKDASLSDDRFLAERLW